MLNLGKSANSYITVTYSFEFPGRILDGKRDIISILSQIGKKKNLRIRDYDHINSYKVIIKQNEQLKGELDGIKKYIIDNLQKVLKNIEEIRSTKYILFVIGEIKHKKKRYTFRIKIENIKDLEKMKLVE